MPNRPNLLFILTDQQRRDSMACYGNRWINTPNLDALVANGQLTQKELDTATSDGNTRYFRNKLNPRRYTLSWED